MTDGTRKGATLDDLLAVVEPGETVAYADIPARLSRLGRPSAGIGVVCQEIAFRGYTQAWRGSEIVSWREPYFDREVEGDWTEGTMYVTRREAPEALDAD
jgi:hypothetical protein